MRQWLVFIFLPVLVAGFAWLYVPSVLSDLSIDKDKLISSEDHLIDDASCKTRLGFISTCKVKTTNLTSAAETTFRYFIVKDLDGALVEVMTDPDSGAVTTSTGMDHLMNRILSLAGFILLMGGGFIIALRKKLSG